MHLKEGRLIELRRRQKTSEGRAKLRKRVVIEHSLARVGQIQGSKAHYRGAKKSPCDVRRAAVVAKRFAQRDAGFAEAA